VRQKPDPFAPLTYTTTVTRDPNGNATRIVQANGVGTDYAFDALDRLTAVTTHPTATTSLTTSYVLDGNGQPTSRTTGDGVSVSYTYDALSRLTAVGGPGLSIAYAYDAAGRRTSMTDSTGTTTYQYDRLGRATQIAAPGGSLGYAYDRDGDRTTLTYPGGQAVTYAYSPGGRLTTVTDWAARTSAYSYTPSGLVSRLAYPNGLVATYGYDRAQRLTDLQYTAAAGSVTLASQHFTLDAEGDRTALDESALIQTTPPTLATDHFTLSYDGLLRLTALNGTLFGGLSSSETFSYDAATNLSSRTGPAATYAIDGANRPTSDGTRAFTWNGADRLIQRGSDTFAYDALGRMTSSSVGSPVAVTRTYSYDGDGLLRTRTGAALTTSFLWDTAVAPAPLLVAGADRVVHGLGPLYLVRADATTLTLVRDALGSVRAEITDAGTIAKAFRYAAYGEIVQPNASVPTLLGFAGELRDPSGLIYLRARWYDAGTGRFMTSDPVSGSQFAPDSLNRFSYASGSPAMRTDPSGLCTDPGGPGVRYCIDRFIPTGSSCVLVLCFRGDARGPLAESAAGSFRSRQLLLSDGSVRSVAGVTRLEPFGWPASEGALENCTSSTGSSIDVSCSATNGLMPFAPPIHTRVKINVVDGHVSVVAAGSRYPSLEVWQYGGSSGPQLVYFYDARSAAPIDLYTIARLPEFSGGAK
jgi:RHS repeat-associated protein